MNNVNEYLENLKIKETYIKTLIEDIEDSKNKILEINQQILKLNDTISEAISIGIWDENSTRLDVERTPCAYDEDEKIVYKKGDYKYLTNIQKNILIDTLNKSKEEHENIIIKKEKEINDYINKTT